jgi:hypothetical protein
MAFYKSKGFKYLKNLIIGVGAAVVMMGALAKILSHPLGNILITAGLCTEAFLFLMLGVLPPEKDNYNANLTPLTAGPTSKPMRPLDADAVESRLGGMLDELQGMSKSLGSLKALQEVDFSETQAQMETMNNFYTKMNDAMGVLTETVEDTKMYKEQVASLNRNLTSLNSVYGNVLGAFRKGIEE